MLYSLLLILLFFSCNKSEEPIDDISCSTDQVLDDTRGECNSTLTFSSEFEESTNSNQRIIVSNSIPNHKVGLFGKVQGALNPNAITEQSGVYRISLNPTVATNFTALISTEGVGPNVGPQYAFGILLNGVELDPTPAEPFPHEGIMSPNVNWEWNLEALNVNLGLDCNNAHVQPQGKYHYHGSPVLYLQNASIVSDRMTLVGYAADGFPIYYKYAYSNPNDSNSTVVEMTSSYQLKTGTRPGDGISAPCDVYNGIYANDYEYVQGLGSLDQANGRTGVTPEYPEGTYYYIITDDFPSIPRYFRGTPSEDFKIGA